MNEFRARLKHAIDSSKYQNSSRALSIDAELGERTVANMLLNEAIDRSKTGPGLFSMARVADRLGISLDWLAGRATPTLAPTEGDAEFGQTLARLAASSAGQFTHGNRPPTPQALMRLQVRGGGQLAAFKDVLKYCDRYECLDADADRVSVIEVGTESLSAITIGESDPSILQIALNTVPDEAFRRKLVNDHQEAQKRGCLCTIEELNVQMPNKPVRVKMDYIRVILKVSDHKGNECLLAYATLVA